MSDILANGLALLVLACLGGLWWLGRVANGAVMAELADDVDNPDERFE